MPFPNFHTCRLKDPSIFDKFRIIAQGRVQAVVGRLKDGGAWVAQSIRYPIEEWTEGEAKKSCDDRDGIRFEPASGARKLTENNMTLSAFEIEASDSEIQAILAGEPTKFASELPTEDIDGVTIFVAGTWTDSAGRKKKYTEADLDEMVLNSHRLAEKLKPFVKLMHLNPKDHKAVTAKPALGWVVNMRREGIKLVADFKKVPQKIAMLLRAGTFRRVSSEIFRKWGDESTGKVYKNVVGAVGLLGAVHPAISTVDDVMKLFGMSEQDAIELSPRDDGWSECYGEDGSLLAFYEAQHQEGGEEMDIEQIKKDVTKDVTADVMKTLDGKVTEAVSKHESDLKEKMGLKPDADIVDHVKALNDDKTKADKELQRRETTDFEAKRDELIEQAKKDGKLIPSQEGSIKTLVSSWVKESDEQGKFSLEIGDETVNGTVLENLKAYFEALPQMDILDKESGKLKGKNSASRFAMDHSIMRGLGSSGVPSKVGGTNINDEVLAYQKENKCDFMTAFTVVTGVTPMHEPDVADYSINDKTDEIHRT